MATIIPLGVQKRRYLSGQGKELWTPLFFFNGENTTYNFDWGMSKVDVFFRNTFFYKCERGSKNEITSFTDVPFEGFT